MKHLLLAIIMFAFISVWGQAPNLEVRSHSDYHPRTQQLILKYHYYYDNWSEREVMHGRYTEWSPKGVLKQEARYQNGKLHGLQVLYWPNGEIKSITKFAEGVISGNREFYFRNGKLKRRESMVENVADGLTTVYNRQGEEIRRIDFIAGKKAPKTDK